jgi:glyoxylase-like metal-dependent hydrolase (beta-lactamase superfamily II)
MVVGTRADDREKNAVMGMRSLPVAPRWFSVEDVGGGVTLITEPYIDEFLRSNIWHVQGRDADLLVDTGNGVAPLSPVVEGLVGDRRRPVLAVATHAHSDHMGGMHEFEHRLIHRAEASELATACDEAALVSSAFGGEFLRAMEAAGYGLPDVLVSALPASSFDPASYAITPASPTGLLDDGDVIDLGDRSFAVLHLPGHSPGSIGLWEEETGILFSGDAVYDGPLLDDLPGSDLDAYAATMTRLHEVPVGVVYPGHDAVFGRRRLVELAGAYLTKAKERRSVEP